MQFQAGATTTFNNMNLAGSASDYVYIYSTADGTQLNVDITGTTTADYVYFKDVNACDSTSGDISTTNSVSTDGNNSCINDLALGSGGGGAVTWDGGGADNDWETALNWSGDAVPGADDDVVIDTEVYVELNGSTTINSLTLGSSTVPATTTLVFNYNATTSGALVIDDGDVIIESLGVITHATGSTDSSITGNIEIDVQTGDLTVNAGGSIDVDGTGQQANSWHYKTNTVGITVGHGSLDGNRIVSHAIPYCCW